MAPNTEVQQGLYLVKTAGVANSVRVSIPKQVREALGIRNAMYMTLKVLGSCIVIVKATSVDSAAAEEEFDELFKRALREWEKGKK